MTTDVSEAIPFMAACHGPTILAELNRLRLDGQLCDITLHVAGHAFGAHKAVLAASCPYFRDHAGLQGLSALHVGVVRSPRVFAQLLAFCYTGRLVLTRREILAFLTAASFLQLQPVIDRCVQLLAGMLSPTSHLTDSSHDSPDLHEPSPPAPAPPPPPPPPPRSASCDRPLLPSTPPAHVLGSYGNREDEPAAGGGGASCGGSEASSWTELGWTDGFVQGSSPEDVTFPPAVSRRQHHHQQQQRHRYHHHQQQQHHQQQLVLLPSRRPRKSATSVRLQIKTEPPDEQMRRNDLDDDDVDNDHDDDDDEEGNCNNSAAEEEEHNEEEEEDEVVMAAAWVGDGGGGEGGEDDDAGDRDEKPAARRRRQPRVIQHADLARGGLSVPRAFSLATASLAAAAAGVIRARSTSPQQHPASADLSPHSDGALPSAAAYADYLQSAAGGGGIGDDCGAASVAGSATSSSAAAATPPPSGQERWMRYNPRLTCLYCGKSFNQKGSLDRHMRLHMGITPFACRHCGKRYTRKDQLEYHIRTHTGNKPFPCALCGKCFPFQATLNQHVRKNHGRGEGGRALRGDDDGGGGSAGRADGGGGEEVEGARAEVALENDGDRSANS